MLYLLSLFEFLVNLQVEPGEVMLAGLELELRARQLGHSGRRELLGLGFGEERKKKSLINFKVQKFDRSCLCPNEDNVSSRNEKSEKFKGSCFSGLVSEENETSLTSFEVKNSIEIVFAQ